VAVLVRTGGLAWWYHLGLAFEGYLGVGFLRLVAGLLCSGEVPLGLLEGIIGVEAVSFWVAEPKACSVEGFVRFVHCVPGFH